jgi:hypothetical protein
VRKSGRTPFGFLGARQSADGHYRYSAASDQTPVWVTAQTLLAVARKPFPLAPVARSQVAAIGGAGGGAAKHGGRANGGGSPDRRKHNGGQPGSGVAAAAADSPRSATGALASNEQSDEGQGDLRVALLGGLGVLAAALVAGFLWYRRRLPY